MLFHPDYAERLRRISERINAADAVTNDLISELIGAISDRHGAGKHGAEKHDQWREDIKTFVQIGAWTDAAIIFMKMELPRWKLRRLVYDEGEWHCAISHQRDLPEWLDATIETHHNDLSIALLKSIVEAIRQDMSQDAPTLNIWTKPIDQRNLICCDNFA
jgi:hypothetical protein